jgi:hypothetical protein
MLNQTRHRSSAVYARLRACVDNPDKKFYVFTNEHRRGLYVDQIVGESLNDRNDRAIRVAAKWFADHTASMAGGGGGAGGGKNGAAAAVAAVAAASATGSGVIMLTDDKVRVAPHLPAPLSLTHQTDQRTSASRRATDFYHAISQQH